MDRKHDIAEVRSATQADEEFAYQVKKAALKDYVDQTWGWEEGFQREFHRRNYHPNQSQIIRLDNIEIGWLEYSLDDEQLILKGIYILPEYQGRGIGSELIRQLIAQAEDKKIPVRLEVLKVNPARHLFEKLGFWEVGETETHYRMRRGS